MTRTLCAAGPIPVVEGRALNVHDRESIAVPPRLSVADPLSGAAHPATRRLSNVRLAKVTPIDVCWLWAIIRVASIDVPINPVTPTVKITSATMVSTSVNPLRSSTRVGVSHVGGRGGGGADPTSFPKNRAVKGLASSSRNILKPVASHTHHVGGSSDRVSATRSPMLIGRACQSRRGRGFHRWSTFW